MLPSRFKSSCQHPSLTLKTKLGSVPQLQCRARTQAHDDKQVKNQASIRLRRTLDDDQFEAAMEGTLPQSALLASSIAYQL